MFHSTKCYTVLNVTNYYYNINHLSIMCHQLPYDPKLFSHINSAKNSTKFYKVLHFKKHLKSQISKFYKACNVKKNQILPSTKCFEVLNATNY